MKQHGDNWKTCDDVLDTINALSKPGDTLKAIKEIRASQKGDKPKTETTESAPPLTIGRAVEYLIAAIKNASKVPMAEARNLFVAAYTRGAHWSESGLSVAVWLVRVNADPSNGHAATNSFALRGRLPEGGGLHHRYEWREAA